MSRTLLKIFSRHLVERYEVDLEARQYGERSREMDGRSDTLQSMAYLLDEHIFDHITKPRYGSLKFGRRKTSEA
jgi:hypothetical protein